MRFFNTNFALNVAIFTFKMRSSLRFYNAEEIKTSISGISEILPSWYILSFKP